MSRWFLKGIVPLLFSIFLPADGSFGAPSQRPLGDFESILWQGGGSGPMPWPEAVDLCASLFSDTGTEGRLPEKSELLTLSRTRLFPEAEPTAYWSGTPDEDGRIWGVSLHTGTAFAFGGSEPALNVRCVFDALPSGLASFPPPSRFVRNWADAWSRRDFDAYLAFYSRDFDPGDRLSHPEWKERRRRALSRPRWIEVSIEAMSASLTDEGVRVEFIQSYRSNLFSDRVRKAILLVPAGATWGIASEKTIETLPRNE